MVSILLELRPNEYSFVENVFIKSKKKLCYVLKHPTQTKRNWTPKQGLGKFSCCFTTVIPVDLMQPSFLMFFRLRQFSRQTRIFIYRLKNMQNRPEEVENRRGKRKKCPNLEKAHPATSG